MVSKAGGVVCEDLVVGTGQEAKHGKMVAVYYEGKLKGNNNVFDSTLKGPPFKFIYSLWKLYRITGSETILRPYRTPKSFGLPIGCI